MRSWYKVVYTLDTDWVTETPFCVIQCSSTATQTTSSMQLITSLKHFQQKLNITISMNVGFTVGLLHYTTFVLENMQTVFNISNFRTGMFTPTGIRRWNYFAAEQLLVYDIANYRWCENVERFHKSNNIMYVSYFVDSLLACFACPMFSFGIILLCRIIVDLRGEIWYQKCHDPECKNFRSSSTLWP